LKIAKAKQPLSPTLLSLPAAAIECFSLPCIQFARYPRSVQDVFIVNVLKKREVERKVKTRTLQKPKHAAPQIQSMA
jgi:hypothetical protein